MTDDRVSIDQLRRLVEGSLPWDEVKKLIRLSPKDEDRFFKYLQVLQSRVPWDDRILLRISDHLFIVAKPDGRRITKCDCGFEFGDYRVNWKLSCRIFVRRSKDEIGEVVTIPEARHNTDLVEMREYYCPGCLALLAVEIVPPGYPPIFEMLPDLSLIHI